MKKFAGYILVSLLIYMVGVPAHAAEGDSIRFSLLTCGTGDQIHTLFGHTAIRMEHPADGVDHVFNYGVFDFNAPHFEYRFMKGKTDYWLDVQSFGNFMAAYRYYNRSVWQQTLDLTPAEKEKLRHILYTNAQPENRMYRYDFFYDNCTTRARDRIEDCTDGKVIYEATDYRKTFREIVREYTNGYPWDAFGIDFCLATETDRPITYREETFAPLYLMEAFRTARIADGEGHERLLAGEPEALFLASPAPDDSGTFTPLLYGWLFCIVLIMATAYGVRRGKSLWILDLFVFAAAGLAGCVAAFLVFFSEHPAVHINFLLMVFHPLHLLLLPFFLRKEARGQRSWYHRINLVVLTLFILLWPVIPQHFNMAVLPLALGLLLRSGSNLILTYKSK